MLLGSQGRTWHVKGIALNITVENLCDSLIEFCRLVIGSGKTAAFLVPVLNRVYENGPGDLPNQNNQVWPESLGKSFSI